MLFAAMLFLVGATVFVVAARSGIGAEEAIRWLRSISGHWWTPLAYAAVYALMNVLFIPTQPLSVAAVVLWGWSRGGVIELIAATAGSMVPYLIARSAARDWVAARLTRHARAAEVLQREGFTMMLILRLVPVIPYTLLNYLAGASAIRPLPYVTATFLGMVPSTFIFAYFVDAVLEGMMRPGEVITRIFVAGVLLAVLVVLARYASGKVRERVQ